MKIISYSYVVHPLYRKDYNILILNITKVKNPGELHSYPGQMKIEF